MTPTRVASLATLLATGALLAACGGGPSDGRPASPPSTSRPPVRAPADAAAADAAAAAAAGPAGAVTFAFAGDTQFGDEQDTEGNAISTGLPVLADRVRQDPSTVLSAIAPTLSGADLAMVNLETSITDGGHPVPGKTFHFRSPPASLTALRDAGVDVATMANNHGLDYGAAGMQDTFGAIASSHFPVLGIGHDAAEAFRPYRATIHALRPQVDTLVVFLHWGTEQDECSDGEQRSLAAALSSAGADIVVGAHAHRVQGAGHLGRTFVAYGLGNFTWWREDGENGRTGVLRETATGRRVDAYSWVPARIRRGVPVPLTGAAAAADVAEWSHRRQCSGLSP